MPLEVVAVSTRGVQREAISLRPTMVVLGGYTARSADARERHVDELRTIGIEPPARIPAFWPVSASLLTTDDRIQVQGNRTSGEVEFALIFHGGDILVAVASDHTDRELETSSIPRSKQCCAKVISREVLAFDDLADRWDSIVISSEVTDEEGHWLPYQRAELASVMPPESLMHACFGGPPVPDGTVLLSGTVPLLDGQTRYAAAFRAALQLPGGDRRLTLEYRIEALPDQAGQPVARRFA